MHHVDAVNARIDAESSVLSRIKDAFTFDVPNARFTPAFRNKMWDGKIRVFNPNTRLLPIGLLDHLLEICRDEGHAVSLDERFRTEYTVEEDDAREFMEGLGITAHGSAITPHSHQVAAFHHAVNRRRCLLLSPTASGKSLVIYSLIRWWLDRIPEDRKVLVVVPTISLVKQMVSDFKDYSGGNGWDAEKMCLAVHGGTKKESDARVVVSTWQSIFKLPKSYFDQFAAVVGDEAHLFKAQSLTGIMTKLTDCYERVALTGTLDGSKTHRMVIEGMFGRAMTVTTTRDLMDKNLVSDLDIECILLTYPEADRKLMKDLTYKEEIDFLVADPRRNEMITRLSTSVKGNTLVLFNYVEKHGKRLFEKISQSTDRKVFYISGDTDADEREAIRKATENEDGAIIVGSYGTLSTGINIRSLRNIVFASPSKSRIRVLQSIGRQLRKSETKKKARLYDIADDMHWKSRKNHTLKHFMERVRIYSEEMFSFRTVRLSMEDSVFTERQSHP